MSVRPPAAIGLGAILLVLAWTLAIGHAVKVPCVHGEWGDGRPWTHLCYSDIVRLQEAEQLEGSRLPYFNVCSESGDPCDEYPPLTMWTMRLAAWASGPDRTQFFYWNAALLWLAAFWITFLLFRMVGTRALYFAAAPTLAIYATINWDLLAVLLATAATFAYLQRRDTWSGTLIGLGTATKFYPALMLAPFAAGRLRDRRPDRGARLIGSAVAAWLVVNVPFLLAAPDGWLTFFRLSRDRPPDWDSLWFIGCQMLTGIGCTDVRLVNYASAAIFGGLVILVWAWKTRRDPSFERWTLAFPVIALFLVTNKVYSPQYSLWLLPWFALALPSWRLFLAFEATDVAVFVTRFSWFGTMNGIEGGLAGTVTQGWFMAASLARALILLVCIVEWVRSTQPAPSVEQPQAELGGAIVGAAP